ncbi:MAG: MarR family transcriptional regulator [Rhodoferax sp.]|jgi:DNA-binding MarR family transcriptional regulator|nr:MarR family transcriptional regulator [Rhodoferax sp.]
MTKIKTPQKDASTDALHAADELGYEARSATGDHAALKLWLRMLACTTQVEGEIRRRLRVRFDTSLPRFDYMAQLYREPEGLRMKDLSSHLMVSGANVTAITDELERDGLVTRSSSPTDRRSWILNMTPKGREQFEVMAKEHEQWVLELFACLDAATLAQMYRQLGGLRVHMLNSQADAVPPSSTP